jgi:hypothetical protein
VSHYNNELIYWPLDASNGLSYSKMLYITNLRHPRRVEDGKFKKFPLCKTKTGWHCCIKRFRKSDFGYLGTGTSLYFKMLKYLIFLFLILSILSVPSYFFYIAGGEIDFSTIDIKTILTFFTLGNIGES